jgi:hypothetical protein
MPRRKGDFEADWTLGEESRVLFLVVAAGTGEGDFCAFLVFVVVWNRAFFILFVATVHGNWYFV